MRPVIDSDEARDRAAVALVQVLVGDLEEIRDGLTLAIEDAGSIDGSDVGLRKMHLLTGLAASCKRNITALITGIESAADGPDADRFREGEGE